MPQKPRKKGMPELFPPRLFAPLKRQADAERSAAKTARRAERRQARGTGSGAAPAVTTVEAGKTTKAAKAPANDTATTKAARPSARPSARPTASRTTPATRATPAMRSGQPQRSVVRKSLTTARAPGRILSAGDRAWATLAANALHAARHESDHAYAFTHGFHTYAAKLHPATVAHLIRYAPTAIAANGVALDPFCGSGTVLVEARAAGLAAHGFDLSPLAVELAAVKSLVATPTELERLVDRARDITNDVIAKGKEARRAGYQASPHHHAKELSARHRNKLLATWFAPHVRRELEALAEHVDELHAKHPASAKVLRMVLSAILYKVSRRTSDTNPAPTEKQIGRGAVARLFLAKTNELARGLAELPSRGEVSVAVLDARQLATAVKPGAATHIITSPPYPGTYDYAHHHDLRFAFLGLPFGEFSTKELGSRRAFAKAPTAALAAWRADTKAYLAAMSAALAPQGFIALVVGDSVAGAAAIYALDEIRALLPPELDLVASASQERPQLGAVEARAFANRPKAEHILILRRRAARS